MDSARGTRCRGCSEKDRVREEGLSERDLASVKWTRGRTEGCSERGRLSEREGLSVGEGLSEMDWCKGCSEREGLPSGEALPPHLGGTWPH